MTSIGKIISSAFQVSQEVTNTLATLNFDFTLLKVEAPKEYASFGMALSSQRRTEAESGTSHQVARKLGGLFQDDLPDTPHLVSAYGKRASEIAESPQSNPKGTAADGPFADHVGADGTTIWAAATSGKNAIAVHLLACMLARIWNQEEAISVWSEFVKEHKRILSERLRKNESFHEATLYSTSIDVSRRQLAEWDSSARAWLRTADTAMQIRQKQLRLIIDNLGLIISHGGGLYQAVMTSWTTAMKAMNKLISGSPLVVKEGSILLALSAWHLYPDMSVKCTVSRFVEQKDPLVQPGGTLTVGLSMRSDMADDAVSWSLPLAHWRYYGTPVSRTATSGLSCSQVSFPEFMCAVLGSVVSTWNLPERHIEHTMSLFAELAILFSQVEWIETLGFASAYFQSVKGLEKENINRIFNYGRRRPEFLAPIDERPNPVFGLLDLNILLNSLRPKQSGEAIETKIRFLRQYASISPYNMKGALIRYFVPLWRLMGSDDSGPF
ncbi:MAG: hypothetical protein Q9160_002614 [Pyrenula sp. 1 TL-2023]